MAYNDYWNISGQRLNGSIAGPSGDNEGYSAGGTGRLTGVDPTGSNQDGLQIETLPDGRMIAHVNTGNGSLVQYEVVKDATGYSLGNRVSNPAGIGNNSNDFWRNSATVAAAGLGAGALAGGAGAAGAAAGAGAGEGAAGAGWASGAGLDGVAGDAAATYATGGGGLLSSGASNAAGSAAAAGTGLLGAAGNALNSPLGATLVGAGLGAASANRPTTSTSSTQLPEYLQPYAPQYAARVNALSNQPFTTYTGQGVAGLNADQQQAAGMVRNMAGHENPLNGAATSQMMDTMGGKYLDPSSNPWLNSTFDQAAKRMTDTYDRSSAGTNSAFNDAGSFGSSGHQALVESNNRAFGDSLAQLGNSIYGGNYQQERSRQAQAGLQAPNVAGQMQSNDFRRAEALGSSGATQQQNTQQGLDWNYGQFQRQQEYPYRQLDTMASMFNPNLGRTQTQTQPGIGTAQGLLGGGAAGYGMYQQANRGGLLGNSTNQSGGGFSQPQTTGYGLPGENNQYDPYRY